MVRPIPSVIGSDSEEENVRNIEIALQSVNIQSSELESHPSQNDLSISNGAGAQSLPEIIQFHSNDSDLHVQENNEEKSNVDENVHEEEEEEGAVGFDSSLNLEFTDFTNDDVFDSSVSISAPFNSTSDETFNSVRDVSNTSITTPKRRYRSLSTNLQESEINNSCNSSRTRRHSSGETSFSSDSNVTLSPSSHLSGVSPRHLQHETNKHSCCSPIMTRGENSQMMSEGATLYREFLREEFRRRNIREPPCLNINSSFSSRGRTNSMSEVIRASNQLCFMSDQFARSPMRQWVQEQADNVSLHNLDFNSFSNLLYGLFQEGGVTWERVLVLFFFCADVSIRAFREKLQGQFHDIINWSLQFISGKRFTQWIQENGGWARVLSTSVDQAYKLAMIGFCTMGMLAFAVYLWKNK